MKNAITMVGTIAMLAGKLPREQQHSARQLGLSLALITRILLLLGITWKPTPGGVFTRFHISDIWLDEAALQRALDFDTKSIKDNASLELLRARYEMMRQYQDDRDVKFKTHWIVWE